VRAWSRRTPASHTTPILRSVTTEYVGQAFVVEADGDEIEVRASLRFDGTDWTGDLIGPADWVGIAGSTEPFFELRLPDGHSAACFVSEFDRAATDQRVTIAGVGAPPFG
jgi:hypothetical protein